MMCHAHPKKGIKNKINALYIENLSIDTPQP